MELDRPENEAYKNYKFRGETYNLNDNSVVDSLIGLMKAEGYQAKLEAEAQSRKTNETAFTEKSPRQMIADEESQRLQERTESLAKPLQDIEKELADLQKMWDRGIGDPELVQRQADALVKRRDSMLGIEQKEQKITVNAALKSEVDDLRKSAQSLQSAVQSPIDKFSSEFGKISKMFELGLIDETTKERGLKEIQKDFLNSKSIGEYKPAEALEAGSVALASFMAKQQSQRQRVVLDAGWNEKVDRAGGASDNQTGPTTRRITDKDGVEVTIMQNLDGFGKVLPEGEKPKYKVFAELERISFAALRLPAIKLV